MFVSAGLKLKGLWAGASSSASLNQYTSRKLLIRCSDFFGTQDPIPTHLCRQLASACRQAFRCAFPGCAPASQHHQGLRRITPTSCLTASIALDKMRVTGFCWALIVCPKALYCRHHRHQWNVAARVMLGRAHAEFCKLLSVQPSGAASPPANFASQQDAPGSSIPAASAGPPVLEATVPGRACASRLAVRSSLAWNPTNLFRHSSNTRLGSSFVQIKAQMRFRKGPHTHNRTLGHIT